MKTKVYNIFFKEEQALNYETYQEKAMFYHARFINQIFIHHWNFWTDLYYFLLIDIWKFKASRWNAQLLNHST